MPLRIRAAVWAAIVVAASAGLYFFYSRGLTDVYGDAMAHMEGARRLFDSLTPGYEEIGTVWLPLPHLLAAPLAINDYLWRTGLAGSFISTAAFIVTAWFACRLAAEMNREVAAGVVALAGFLLCPNMLYLASTPLTEPLAILWMVLMAYGLFRYQESGSIWALIGAGAAAFCGTWTRYDGWSVLPFAALFVLLARQNPWPKRLRHSALFSATAGTGPALWLLHNAYKFGNALEFYNGPYSAKAIYAHQLATTAFAFPTDGSILVSARYYLEDLKLVIGVGPLVLALLGLIAWMASESNRRRRAVALLFLVPLPFNIQAMAHSAVPLYVPTLFPNTYWNLRLGMEMLPAAAIFPSFLLFPGLPRRLHRLVLAALLLIIIGQAVLIASHGASELAIAKEGILNTPCKSPRRQAVIRVLRQVYDGGNVLIASGKWPCVMREVGIPFHRTLTGNNRRFRDLLRTDPAKWAEWIVRGDDDDVDILMRAYPEAYEGFEMIFQANFPGEGSVEIYRRRHDSNPLDR
jgi:4-amino-4-deoxy-L-arabinose transferase-like glycosyltransferase